MKCGGGSRTRTGDIRLAKPTLYQLSYAPSPSAREAESDSVSFRARSSVLVCFLGGGGSKLPSAMCRRVGEPGRKRPGTELTN